MMKITTDYANRTLGTWLRMIHKNEVALPIFQRSKKWNSKTKAKLLMAILEGRPVGVPMVLECSKGKAAIKARVFSEKPEKTWSYRNVTEQILDGQQRLASIKEMLEGTEYYIKIKDTKKFADKNYHPSNIEIEVVHSKSNKFARNPAVAYEQEGLVPVSVLCPEGALPHGERTHDRIDKWHEAVCADSSNISSRIREYMKVELYTAIENYNLHYCKLPNDTPRDAAIDIFIDTNKNGTPVTKFEIITALADRKYELDIRKSINAFCNDKECQDIPYYFNKNEEKRVSEIGEWLLKIACLQNGESGEPPVQSRFFEVFESVFQIPSLSAGRNIEDSESAKKAENLKRKKPALRNTKQLQNKFAKDKLIELLENLDAALKFAAANGVPTQKALGNEPAIYVIAGLQTVLRASGKRNVEWYNFTENLLSVYFWRTFFTDRYAEQANQELFNDFVSIKKCITAMGTGGNCDWDFGDCEFLNEKRFRLPTVKDLACTKNPWPWPYQSSNRKGRALAAAMLLQNPVDWGWGRKLDQVTVREFQDTTNKEHRLDRHHIFPKKFLSDDNRNCGLQEKLINHAMNCTFLSQKTNTMIGGNDPATYIRNWKGLSKKKLKSRVTTHCIPFDILENEKEMPEWYMNFINGRAKKLIKIIEELTRLQK